MEPAHKIMVEEALAAFGHCTIVAGGESMKPFIRAGDTVTLLKKKKHLRIGEIVAFFNKNQLVIHRIVWLSLRRNTDPVLWVWGDSSPGMPAKIFVHESIGIVRSVARNNKQVSAWTSFPFRIVAVVAGIMLHCAVHAKNALSRSS